MKHQEPRNNNYAAVVTTVRTLVDLQKCDNVVGLPVFGYQAIVSKDIQIGDRVVFFPAESQLSEEFCRIHNLFRDKTLNGNPEKSGYFDNNRRVKAVKFRGHRSDAFVMPLASLSFTGAKLDELKDNDVFDTLNGVELCRKYEVKQAQSNDGLINGKVKKAFKRVNAKLLPEHYDTDNWWRAEHTIDLDQELVVTVKLHGSSARFANIPVRRNLTRLERFAMVRCKW